MPAPEFRWSEHTVGSAAPLGPAGPAAESAAAGEPVTVQLPDLWAWRARLDKAEVRLESAPEVEHASMVQYLYARLLPRTEQPCLTPLAACTRPAASSAPGERPRSPQLGRGASPDRHARVAPNSPVDELQLRMSWRVGVTARARRGGSGAAPPHRWDDVAVTPR